MSDTILEYKNVSFAYPGGKPVFENISMNFEKGRVYLIEGPSGSGKSTFLRLANRLEEPSAGDIRFKGAPVASYAPVELRRSVLYVQQVPQVLDSSVRDNLLLPFSFNGNRHIQPPDDKCMQAFMERLLLTEVSLDASAKALSTGQQQRICFIRGLLLSPEVMLLDEPTSALDEESCRLVQETSENLCRENGATVIMVSHRKMDTCSPDAVQVIIAKGGVVSG